VERTARPGLGKQAGELVERAVDKLAKGDARAALEPATRARELAPRAPAAREVLGMALYGLGRWREALRELQTYKRLTGRADQNHLIADCHRALGAPEKAVPLAQEAVRGPIPAEVRAEAAVVGASALGDLGRYTEGLSLLRRYRIEEPKGMRNWDLRVRYVEADLLERSGQLVDAREAFESILRHDVDAFDVRDRLAKLPAKPAPEPRAARPRREASRTGRPRTSKPGTSKPRTAKPRTAKPRAAKPRTARAGTATPRTAKPRTAKPRTAKPRTAKPGTGRPRTAKPPAGKPLAGKPRAAAARTGKPAGGRSAGGKKAAAGRPVRKPAPVRRRPPRAARGTG
jgi:tetratricopeptide (TPR) repeat protein